MKELQWCRLFALLAYCALGRSQGILIPVSSDPVEGAPFALTVENTSETAGDEGTKQDTRRILRDSAGRQRYDAPVVDGVPRSSVVNIYDVVAGKIIKLDTSAKTALITPMQVGQAVVLDVSTATSLAPPTVEDGQTLLGTRHIAGLEAWGQRTMKTTSRDHGPALTQDRELWLSTHYGMPVMQIMRRPQGKTTQAVVSFSAQEPDPSLFKIPEGYTASDAPPPPPPPPPAPGTVRVGGNVSAPVVIKVGQPEFTDQARNKKVSGEVLLHLIVDEQGLPQQVMVVRGLGMGLDENAIKAVKKYRFKPAMREGVPVKVELNIAVNFQIL